MLARAHLMLLVLALPLHAHAMVDGVLAFVRADLERFCEEHLERGPEAHELPRLVCPAGGDSLSAGLGVALVRIEEDRVFSTPSSDPAELEALEDTGLVGLVDCEPGARRIDWRFRPGALAPGRVTLRYRCLREAAEAARSQVPVAS